MNNLLKKIYCRCPIGSMIEFWAFRMWLIFIKTPREAESAFYIAKSNSKLEKIAMKRWNYLLEMQNKDKLGK